MHRHWLTVRNQYSIQSVELSMSLSKTDDNLAIFIQKFKNKLFLWAKKLQKNVCTIASMYMQVLIYISDKTRARAPKYNVWFG